MLTVSLPVCLCSRLRKDEESLTIPNINEGDEGTYTCTVTSEIDQDSASARLTVLGTEVTSEDSTGIIARTGSPFTFTLTQHNKTQNYVYRQAGLWEPCLHPGIHQIYTLSIFVLVISHR